MASTRIRTLYLEERRNGRTSGWVGHAALGAYRAALVRIKWEAIEDMGLVELDWESDDDPDLSWLNEEDYSDTRQDRACYKHNVAIVRDYGARGLIGRYRLCPDARWETGDALWGIVEDESNPERSFAAIDIMSETLKTFRDAFKRALREHQDRSAGRCPHCHGSGRIAS